MLLKGVYVCVYVLCVCLWVCVYIYVCVCVSSSCYAEVTTYIRICSARGLGILTSTSCVAGRDYKESKHVEVWRGTETGEAATLEGWEGKLMYVCIYVCMYV